MWDFFINENDSMIVVDIYDEIPQMNVTFQIFIINAKKKPVVLSEYSTYLENYTLESGKYGEKAGICLPDFAGNGRNRRSISNRERTENMDIEQFINIIKLRPGMFIGDANINNMRNFESFQS